MSDNPENPIPFNPATMTVSDVLSCAETLSALFNMLDKQSDEQIVHSLRSARDYMIRKAKHR
jgi:hypothetical protein